MTSLNEKLEQLSKEELKELIRCFVNLEEPSTRGCECCYKKELSGHLSYQGCSCKNFDDATNASFCAADYNQYVTVKYFIENCSKRKEF